jgi:4-hydroxy-3-methylbut-2-enyl diphosphate reductase
MELISLKPRSYCKGVVLAIRKALETKAQNPDKTVSVLGKIVHNQYVVDALEKKEIHTIDRKGLSREELLDLVPPGIVIFTAHGVAESVYKKAQDLGLEVVDATCPEVAFTQNLVREKLGQGYEVVYIGKKGHPEAIGVCQDKPRVHLVETAEDVARLAEENGNFEGRPIFVTNQTTLSVLNIQSVFDAIKDLYPYAEIMNEICQATRIRQEAVRKAGDLGLDVLLVMGDPSSNNTRMLADIGRKEGIPQVYRVESVQDVDLNWFNENSRVGVTAGASTPPYLIKQLEDYLNNVDLACPGPLPEVDLDRLLEI